MPSQKVDLFDSYYSSFEAEVHARIRKHTYGEDFGQNGWTTIDEFAEWIDWLNVGRESRVLDVACGAGGPILTLSQRSGARVVGLDVNVAGIEAAQRRAQELGLESVAEFAAADARARLPISDGAFQGIICIDAANHFPDRQAVLKEWSRCLASGGRLLFTDPVVISGPVTNEELAIRSSIFLFVFVPLDVTRQMIDEAGLEIEKVEDRSENAVATAQRWHDARAKERDALIEIEGEERYEGLQTFFETVARVTREGRLSRLVFYARKR